MEIWGKTDIGKVRPINQDTYQIEIINPNTAILCVCDGMGGQKAGHIASKYALSEFIFSIKQDIKDDMSDSDIKEILEKAIASSNKFVYEMAVGEKTLSDMGTTLIGGIIHKSTFYVANIGDSRCYHINNESITQVTKDHSLVQQLLDNDKITLEESYNHPKKNIITRAVGINKKVRADIYKIKLAENEYILLCSDGLYNHLDQNEMKKEVLADKLIKEKCEKLVDIANENGGFDNITIIILQF